MVWWRTVVGVVVAHGALGAPFANAADRFYAFYDLGDMGCLDYMEATDVNDMGVVTGNGVRPDCVLPQGFGWFNGVLIDFDEIYHRGLVYSAEGISQTGVVLGSGSPDRVLIVRGDVAMAMSVPPECTENLIPVAINAAGTLAVGACVRNDGTYAIFGAIYVTEDGTALVLSMSPDAPPDAFVEVQDIDNDGVAVGYISYSADETHAFMWLDGVMTEIVNSVGGTNVHARRINNVGLVVGNAETPTGTMAMSYDINTGVMTVLGSGSAYGVNDRGAAVGRIIIEFSDVHPLLYEDGETIDLSPFFPGSLTDNGRARAINNHGWIVGWGEDDEGIVHGWLLVPIYDKGDFDGDGDVDLQDSGHFQRCFAAEPYIDGTLHVGCSVFDFDDDVDLDLDDYAAFQSAFTGPTAPNNNPNGPG